MSLPPERQPTEATQKLTELFWRRGYEATSIEDVVQATGMNRYALYNAFGGKHELFLTALDAYYQERKQHYLAHLENPDIRPLDAINAIMELAISEMADRGAGCFICNVANEIGPHDPIIAERVKTYLDEIEAAYHKALSHAEENAELNYNITPEDGAKMLIAVQLGIGVRAQAGAPYEDLLMTFRAALRALSPIAERAAP